MIFFHFATLPLKKKLFYSYALPVTAVFALLFAVLFPRYYSYGQKGALSAMEKSVSQAAAAIAEYENSMYYLSGILENNADIISIVGSEGLNPQKSVSSQYREFLALKRELDKLSSAHFQCIIALYIPDSLVYANNNVFFFAESDLEKRADFAKIQSSLAQNQRYCTIMDELVHFQNANNFVPYVALLARCAIPSASGKRQFLVSKVAFPLSKFERALSQSNFVSGSSVFLSDGNGNIIAKWGNHDNFEYFAEKKTKGKIKHENDGNWVKTKISGKGIFWEYSALPSKYGWQVHSVIPERIIFDMNLRLLMIFALLFFATTAVVFAVSYMLSSSYVKQLSLLANDMEKLGSGDFSLAENSNSPDFSENNSKSKDEIDAIRQRFSIMSLQLQALMTERYKQGQTVAIAELKALQAQINPHFLYNTLDLINWEAMRYNAQSVAQIARNLGQFYRLSLNRGKAAVLIRDELKHVQTYVNIENFHFNDCIHLEIIVPEAVQKYACLGIILQPFVENAIVHGIAEHPEINECSITISASLSDDDKDILFDIRDNGPGFSEERQKQILDEHFSGTWKGGYGIRNINARLRLCYGEDYGISFRSSLGKGTIISVRIKALTLSELDFRLA